MNTKKVIVLLTLTIISSIALISTASKTKQYTLKESLDLAFVEARKYDPNIKLYMMSSLDKMDEKRYNLGTKGKRERWNFIFGIPNTSKQLLITL